ncbi:MAG: undecaprenyl-diphosphate phosphatase [Gemmatimonadota bacterium]|nr:undecaprenyl-diphosphate phosphatase [Gemmatimonadota bacterium]
MTFHEALLLGIVQGLSEFLPVSSSGHLVLGQALLGVQPGDLVFEVIVHFGTLLAVLTVLGDRIRGLASGCVRRDPASLRMALLLLVGTVPAGAIGLFFEDYLTLAFQNPAAAAGCLVATGAVLWSTRYVTRSREEIGVGDALLIGFAQAFAILPGISRSGLTICAGLWRGIDGREAASFSFLLSIPVILGATVVKAGSLIADPPDWNVAGPLLIGLGVAFLSGVVAIRWLFALLRGGRLDRFSYYCWAIGFASLTVLWLST